MASEAQKFWISYLTLKENVYQAVPRAYLKTPNAPGQRAFLRCAASFFLEIRQYSCEKMSCATQKSLAAGHIMSFQIHPSDTMRSGFFQLKEPSAADGEYTARFDAFYFADEDYTTEYEKATPNQKAVRDQAGIKDQLRPPKFADAMLEILSKDDHAAVLDVSETVTITFCLSGDPRYPLTYTACRVQQSNAE